MLKKVRFRFRPEGYWIIDISRDYPHVTFLMSLIYIVGDTVHTDVVVYADDPADVDAIEARCRDHPQVEEITRVYDGPRGTRFHASYREEYSFYPDIVRHTPVAIGTVGLRDGTERYEIIGEPEDLRTILDIMEKRGEVEVEGVEAVPSEVDAAEDLPTAVGLTDKQVEALLSAHVDGYYRWPRERSASDLAAKADVSLSAFLDRLRRAESKVLDWFVERMREESPTRHRLAGLSGAGGAGEDEGGSGQTGAAGRAAEGGADVRDGDG